MNPGTFRIEHRCPQCGAPVTVGESDRLFCCGHCRVRLYLAGDGAARYYLPPAPSLAPEDLLYTPYWHVRGAHFSILPFEIKHRFIDTSRLASGPEGMPLSLGVRAQAMKLRLAVAGVAGKFIRPTLSYGDMTLQAGDVSRALGGVSRRERVFHTAFIGEAASLIYAPVCLREGKLYDAVLDRPLFRLTENPADDPSAFDDSASWRMTFLPALCPNCGWDLPGDRKSEVLLCGHCARAWQAEKGRFKETPFALLASDSDADVHFPFWRLSVDVNGLSVKSFADLARLANLPMAVKVEWEQREPFFWAPAFRSRPRLFLRLSKQLTAIPVEVGPEDKGGEGGFHPVTMGSETALESVKLTLAQLAVPKKHNFPLLPEVTVSGREATLVYLPFKVKGGDYIQPSLKISFRCNALRA